VAGNICFDVRLNLSQLEFITRASSMGGELAEASALVSSCRVFVAPASAATAPLAIDLATPRFPFRPIRTAWDGERISNLLSSI
jgi:hypothetical protein